MESKIELWRIFCQLDSLMSKQFRTRNIKGDFAEELLADFYGGKLAKPSEKAYDFNAGGKKYQVKSRIANPNGNFTGNLSDIHSWNFDFLIVVFFKNNGEVYLVKEYTNVEARALASTNRRASVIGTSTVLNNRNMSPL